MKTQAPPADQLDIDIDALEGDLRAMLADVTLVAEIDLDEWGPLAEKGLRTRVHRCDAAKLGRLWPATYATYLVYQGVQVYEEATFWRYISIEELRDGSESGPAFHKALATLKLPTFEDLEELEGITKNSRGKHIRRLHLHGGIPRDSVASLMQLLHSTLRSGASSTDEVLDVWDSIDLDRYLKRVAARRCLTYSGSFASSLISQLIELVRRANRNEPLDGAGASSHLTAGVQQYLERLSLGSQGWEFVEGPRICTDPFHGEPYLRVPPARDVDWYINGEIAGYSSRQVAEKFPLSPTVSGQWKLTSEDDDGVSERVLRAENLRELVMVFDERGRLRSPRRPLAGRSAYVLAPATVTVPNVTDRRSLAGEWGRFTLSTVDVRSCDELALSCGNDTLSIPVEQVPFTAHLGHGIVEGLLVDDDPVVSGVVTLAFEGFITPAHSLEVVTDMTRTWRLDSLDRYYGEYDITSCLDREHLAPTTVIVRHGDEAVANLRFTYLRNLTLDRPRLSPPDTDVRLVLSAPGIIEPADRAIVMPAHRSEARVELDLLPGGEDVVVSVNRLKWVLEGEHTMIPLYGREGFAVHRRALYEHTLELVTNGVPAQVRLLDAPVEHSETARQDRHRPRIRVAPIRAFGETARRSGEPECRVAVQCGDEEPIVVGLILNRFEPRAIANDILEEDDRQFVLVSWSQTGTWPGREVRLWSWGREPAGVHAVADADTTALIDVTDLSEGTYIVDIVDESAARSDRPSSVPPGATVFLGTETAHRLRDAVLNGDRDPRLFSDDELDELVPVMVDLAEEIRLSGGDRSQRVALLERVADDHHRLIDLVAELDDRLADPDAPGIPVAERHLIDLLAMAWVHPVIDPEADDLGMHLEHLWEIAPMIAACLDRVPMTMSDRAIEDCDARWLHYAGADRTGSRDLAKAVGRLTAVIPPTRQPGLGAAQPLSAEGWATALAELDAVRQQPGWDAVAPLKSLVKDVERAARRAKHLPPWSSAPRRVRERAQRWSEAGVWAGNLVLLACELLEPASSSEESELIAALTITAHVAPNATRTAVVHSAALLRTINAAGAAGRLLR